VANTGGVGLTLRSSPTLTADGGNVIAVLPEGTRLKITGGPQQSDGYTWWNVTGTQVGWAAVGDWLSPTDPDGVSIGAQVKVSNTGGAGLQLRDQPRLSGAVLKALPEGTIVTVLGGPYLVDSYAWWNIKGDVGSGFCAVADWLLPDVSNSSGGTSTLTVASSGITVSVAVAPSDINGAANGMTQFLRAYVNGTNVSLSAPATIGGTLFQKWQKDNADWSLTQSTNLTIDGNHTMTAVYAQPQAVQIKVQTNPEGFLFAVDGTNYSVTQVFSWTPGSTHIISVPPTQAGGVGIQYIWNGWSDSGAITHNVSPMSAITYTANVGTQYLLAMNSGSGGTVIPPNNWIDSGQIVSISAIPNVNFAFANWTGIGQGSFSGRSNPASVTMTGPVIETANFVQAQIQLILEQSGPGSNQAAALDSILFLRDPFLVINPSNLYNSTSDRNTRVLVFAGNLQLAQGETSSAVVVNIIDGNNQSFDVAAEDVEQVPGFNFTQVIFRLPNSLAAGTCTIQLRAHGQVSNQGTIRIRN